MILASAFWIIQTLIGLPDFFGKTDLVANANYGKTSAKSEYVIKSMLHSTMKRIKDLHIFPATF